MYVYDTLPADFIRLEATPESYRLFGAVAAGVFVVVADVTLLAFLYNLVSTDGLITDCTAQQTAGKRISKYKDSTVLLYLKRAEKQ